MNGNNYDGVIESWKVELIRSRARRLGFRCHDLEDAEQEVILDVMNFKFDPAKSNGATERTALTSLIDHQLITFQRTLRRHERLVQLDDGDEGRASEPTDSQAIALDVRQVVERLSDDEQVVCAALSRGESVAQIARQLSVGWHAANQIVNRVRERFTALGVDGWVRV